MSTVLLTHAPSVLMKYFGSKAIASLEALAEVRFNPAETDWTVETLVAAAHDCDVIVADRRTEAPAGLFRRLPRLIAFARCAVDVRNIDVVAASREGVLVTHCSAGFLASVSEWVIGVTIDLSRGVGALNAAYHAGVQPVPPMGRELRGATLGIIGYGQVGRYLGELALAFGMRVLVSDPRARIENTRVLAVSQAELLAESDYVVCLAIATPETENLMDAAAFSAMKPTAFFINASRGNLVDEAALTDALDNGTIAGCALDVGRAADQMPSPALTLHPRVIATPHIGGLTAPAVEHQALEAVAQVAEILQGRVPPGEINAAAANRLVGLFR